MLREEVSRLLSWEERHRRLVARLVVALALTAAIDAGAAVAIDAFESGKADIGGFGDALFFSTTQLLTVSSQIDNPVTTVGRCVDVFLELWAIVVVTGVAGAFAAFFAAADRPH